MVAVERYPNEVREEWGGKRVGAARAGQRGRCAFKAFFQLCKWRKVLWREGRGKSRGLVRQFQELDFQSLRLKFLSQALDFWSQALARGPVRAGSLRLWKEWDLGEF